MTAIYLIRHGQNDYVEKGKLAGRLPGVHLNTVGKDQAAQTAEALRKVKLQGVYSSPLERAIETADEIAAVQGLKVNALQGLGEVNIGRWEGLSLRAARRRKLWPTIQQSPSLARFPDGESFLEAQARMVETLEGLRAQHSGVIACISHADPIKLAIAYYIGLPIDSFQRLNVDPASISELDIEKGSARLIRLNVILRSPSP
ncbi:MAG: histidine phosphatase family protein [Anaerolineales bacterium]